VLLDLLPSGLKGLSFAALTAAIVASLAGKANSISTIFVLDLYKKYFDPGADEKKQVRVGRIAIIVALAIGAVVAPALANFGQAFQFIQDFTGLISPGVVAIFLLGFFWKRTTATAALVGALATIPTGLLLESVFHGMPFLHRMGWVFAILAGLMIVVSLLDSKNQKRGQLVEVDPDDFRLKAGFAAGAILVLGILTVLYWLFW
jgi:solute:Na+ symporter, SSS family